jgi:chemotaxis protein histidine kinase CheA
MAQQSDRDPNIFSVDSRFQQLARRPGGVTRERAIESAQRHIEELKTDFGDWLDRELQDLAGSIRQLDANPGNAAMLDRAEQACGQLRDVGATMGYELLSFIASNFCHILDAIKAGAAYDKDMIDCHMDALLLARTEQYRHLTPDQVPEMASGLRRVVELANASARERK